MSTRSNVGYWDPKRKAYIYVYHHWDGYPSHKGKILLKDYNTFKKAKEMVDLGGCSVLEPTLSPPKGKPHTFDKPIDGVSIFYGRDRGEKGNNPRITFLPADVCQNEFAYLFKKGKWHYWNSHASWPEGTFKVLELRDCEWEPGEKPCPSKSSI